jgi:AcrR family transcriptional regulator
MAARHPAAGARSSKSSKRERTRSALLEAATVVIGERGFDRASLEEIAQQAGMTRGAVYGNFKNKEELFLAMINAHWQSVPPPFVPGASFKEQMRILGKTVAAEAVARRRHAAAATAYQLYVLTNEAMRSRMARQNAATYRMMARNFLKVVKHEELPMPAARLMRVLDALSTGLQSTYFQTPELIGEDVFIAAFEALA